MAKCNMINVILLSFVVIYYEIRCISSPFTHA